MTKLRITYEIITPESAEHGDAEERGYVAPGGWQDSIDDIGREVDIDSVYGWSLSDAERFLGRGAMEDSGNWFNTVDPDNNYQTGAQTFYSLHPPDNISAASYGRLARIFCF